MAAVVNKVVELADFVELLLLSTTGTTAAVGNVRFDASCAATSLSASVARTTSPTRDEDDRRLASDIDEDAVAVVVDVVVVVVAVVVAVGVVVVVECVVDVAAVVLTDVVAATSSAECSGTPNAPANAALRREAGDDDDDNDDDDNDDDDDDDDNDDDDDESAGVNGDDVGGDVAEINAAMRLRVDKKNRHYGFS